MALYLSLAMLYVLAVSEQRRAFPLRPPSHSNPFHMRCALLYRFLCAFNTINYILSAAPEPRRPRQGHAGGRPPSTSMVERLYQCHEAEVWLRILSYGQNIESIQISTQPPPYQWKLVQRDENPPSEQDGSGGRGSPAYRHFALVSGAEHVQRRYLKLGLSLPNNNGIPAWLVVDGNAIACRVYDIRSTGVSPQQPWPAMRLRATGPAPPPPPIMVLPLPDGLEVAKYIMAESGSWGVRRVPVFLDVNREGAPGSGGRFTFKITFAVDGGIEIGPLALKRDAGGCMVLMEINSITESSFEKAAEECGQKLNPREMRLCGENNKPVLYFGDDRIELRKDYMP